MPTPLKSQIQYRDSLIALGVVFAVAMVCRYAQVSLLIPLLLLFLGLHLYFFNKASLKLFLNLGLLLSVILFLASLFKFYPTVSILYCPVASIPMLTMLLFEDLQLVFVMGLLSSTLAGLVFAMSPWLGTIGLSSLELVLVFFLGSLVGAYAVRDARRRGTIIKAGIYVGLIQSFGIILSVHTQEHALYWPDFLTNVVRPAFTNGALCVAVVMLTSRIFEFLFGAISNFSLLELSDFHHPLLKRLELEAPGTFHHSLVVSQIAESAAEAIGANALLAKVGSYYHDIGKLVKPEYFTENQIAMGNKHDDLEPSISRLVVLNHVKEGIELAKKHNLNPIIASFIPEHHGTSLMHYFYQKAISESQNLNEVEEDKYRYPGPKPQRKETAIVLLADSAEAATRSLDEVTPNRIDEIVRKVINNKFIDGQLDESHLTLKEIETIAVTFSKTLAVMYHSRIKYPELKNASDYRNPKPPKENPA